jgi:hypothetical protein
VRERVFHNKFGHGTVIATAGPKLTIDFDDGGVKCSKASSNRLTKTSHSIVVRRIAASQNKQRIWRTTHALQKADN